mmetsp:Transcript_13843/g.44545  ORF Transcript_13843/g.44545 Transcript_13843/m.44545 type:complete len:213 (-) Transcript_13843:143-781(-)
MSVAHKAAPDGCVYTPSTKRGTECFMWTAECIVHQQWFSRNASRSFTPRRRCWGPSRRCRCWARWRRCLLRRPMPPSSQRTHQPAPRPPLPPRPLCGPSRCPPWRARPKLLLARQPARARCCWRHASAAGPPPQLLPPPPPRPDAGAAQTMSPRPRLRRRQHPRRQHPRPHPRLHPCLRRRLRRRQHRPRSPRPPHSPWPPPPPLPPPTPAP